MSQSPYEGKLIRLRAKEPEDEPSFYRWINDHEVIEYLNARYPFSHAQEREWIAATAAPGYARAAFAVETLADRTLIGHCDLVGTSPEHRSAILGIMIGEKSCWDGGYGTDTMRTLCRFGFEEMNLHRIQMEVIAGNDRALHVYKKIGFKVEGTRREAHFRHGAYRDSIVMGLLEGELRSG